ncbi:hypothetical protein Q3G72_028431 [Acer saccharum]|nr:hypothetical protein Q3G72_028431 [Acer saccharum]
MCPCSQKSCLVYCLSSSRYDCLFYSLCSKRLSPFLAMDGSKAGPPKEMPSELDATAEEEYAFKSNLLQEFIKISNIDKAWTFNSGDGLALICNQGFPIMVFGFRGSLGFGEEALQSLPGNVGSQYARALKEKGVETKVIVFPKDVHGIDRPQSDFESFLNIGLWFKKYCK